MKQNQEPCTKTKKVINGGKKKKKSKRKTVSEAKPVENIDNINKSLQSFLQTIHMQMEVLPSDKLQDHAHEYYNPFKLKEDNLS